MAIPLRDKITLEIDTGDEVEKFDIDTYIVMPKSAEKKIKDFEEKLKKETNKIKEQDSLFFEEYNDLEKKYSRLVEDLEDINFEIESEEDEKEVLSLIKTRRELRNKLRPIEDELQKKNKEAKEKQEKLAELVKDKMQETFKKVFEVKVKDSEEKNRLMAYIDELGMDYSLVVNEITRLAKQKKEAKKK